MSNRAKKGLKKGFVFMIAALSSVWTAMAEDRPNVLVYLADDLGYGSINPYGAPEDLLQTPHLNKLAANGVQFNNGYASASVCTPTRYALLAGEYSWRTRMKKSTIRKDDYTLLDHERTAFPKWMQRNGYQTAHVGKWHLGYKGKEDFPVKNLLGDLSPGPVGIGFDYHFGVPYNLEDIHKVYIENNRIWGLRSDELKPWGNNWYAEKNGKVQPYTGYDAPQRVREQVMNTTTGKAVEWLKQTDKEKPFFLYFCSVAVHNPIEPTPEMRGKSKAGLYGDFIQDVDASFGRLINCLEEMGELENTLIFFVSDNGGQTYNKASPQADAANAGLFINGNIKGDKGDVWEGGFKIPFMVSHLNGRIPQGKVSDRRVCTVDIYATVADYISGSTTPEHLDSLDGVSFKDALLNPETSTFEREPLVLRDVQGRKALRFNAWKYIEPFKMDKKVPEEMLFNLDEDPQEKKNVLAQHPEVAQKARQILENIVNKTKNKS